MLPEPRTATLVSAQTLTGSAVVQDEAAMDIKGYPIITLTGTVNNAVDNALVYVYLSNSTTAPTDNTGLPQLMTNADEVPDGALLAIVFPVNDVTAYTIMAAANYLIVYVARSAVSTTSTLTLTAVATAR